MNGTPETIAELNDLPVKTVERRDHLHARCGPRARRLLAADQHRAAGRHARRADDDLQDRQSLHAGHRCRHQDELCRIAAQALPPELKITPLFDQSLFVRAAIQGVMREALIAACLTALMILLFLGDWRPTLIIAISIPLSIFVSVILLSALGETINIMTLGGLALAVGILVDDATVEIENIERNLAQGKELKQAILDGAQQIAVPAFVSTLCICIVFVPMFFLTGVAQVPVRAAGRGGGVRHAGLLPAFANPGSDAGDVHHARARAQSRRAQDLSLGASNAASSRNSKLSAAAIEQLLELTLEHRKLFASLLPRILHAVARAGVRAGRGLLPFRGCRLDPAASARARRVARRRDGAAERPGGERPAPGNSESGAPDRCWTTLACPIPVSTCPTAIPE